MNNKKARLPRNHYIFDEYDAAKLKMIIQKYGPEGVYILGEKLMKMACDDIANGLKNSTG